MGDFRVYHLDDEDDAVGTVQDTCSVQGQALGCQVDYRHYRTIDALNQAIAEANPDLLIVDLRLTPALEDRRGWGLITGQLGKSVVPILVYSGYATVPPRDDLRNPLIVVVKKGEEGLATSLRILMKLKFRLDQERNSLNQRMDEVTLETVSKLFGDTPVADLEEGALASLVRSRLASVLVNLPGNPDDPMPPESVFVYPPLQLAGQSPSTVLAADFVRFEAGPNQGLWWIVSPTCDMVKHEMRGPKIESLLAVHCHTTKSTFLPPSGPLRDMIDRSGREDPETAKRIREYLVQRVTDGSVFVLKCTGALFGSSYVLVDFKDYRTIGISDFSSPECRRVASMSSPYSESMRAAFFDDLGRIGTPDTSGRESRKDWVEGFVRQQ